MKHALLRFLLILACLALLAACRQPHSAHISPLAGQTERRLQTMRDLTRFDAAAALIDSVEDTGQLPASWIHGQRGCLYDVMQLYRQAEEQLELAMADKTLRSANRPSYLLFARHLVDAKISLRKWEEALRLAQHYCSETRDSDVPDEQMCSIRMYAYIGSCQIRLHHWGEAQTISENVYQHCLNYERRDPSLSRETLASFLCLTEAYCEARRWEETERWTDRSLQALERVPLFVNNTSLYDQWMGYLYAIRSAALYHLGRQLEAAVAFRKFEESRFGHGLGRLNGIPYLLATGQWDRVEAMIPLADSLIVRMGSEIVPEYLSERYGYQYDAYRHLGRTDKVLAVTDSVFRYFRTATDNERISKAQELAAQYETQEKENQLHEKEVQIGMVWTGSLAVLLLLAVIGLTAFMLHRRRTEQQLMAEHQKLTDAYEQLKLANARAEEASKMKTHFIAQVSHEIRTPLNILSGFAQILTNPSLKLDDATKAEASQSIVANTQRITRLVNKMLELSDISSKAVIERSDMAAAIAIAQQAVDESGIAELPGVSFSFEPSTAVEELVVFTHLRSAVRSLVLLLDNAHKFLVPPQEAQRGSVSLRVEPDESSAAVVFVVEDSGIGIPAGEAEHVFEEFVQLNDYYDGTGIGLTVARNLARRIGGDIRLDTTYEQGARFCLFLPTRRELE